MTSQTPKTLAERLKAAEDEWLSETTPDAIPFVLFEKHPPKPMRRHKHHSSALADIIFDGKRNHDGLWLGMIVSEAGGAGSALLRRIKEIADKYGLSIEGDVAPLRPSNWDPSRRYTALGRLLAPYYLKRGFKIVGGDKNGPRVRYLKSEIRPKVSEATLVDFLIDETGPALGRDAIFLRKAIAIRRRAGEPNWDANCGIAPPAVLRAFAQALSKLQKEYDLE